MPDPLTTLDDPALRELSDLVERWARRHRLGLVEECRRLAALLAGRLDAHAWRTARESWQSTPDE